ncbi:MAG: COX15/CtaA family protein [Piscinibacter sp.]|uniref:COX15/CtaA family protein n=1 Tax=Piscinibacter sp. TaxID=1903157 RepID=UPI0025902618|nr:COX15/CtaA family protein [Piscinibacter sp.]MCW5666963.1 COX15/CtaA family protein [Piscinibacter sp.]
MDATSLVDLDPLLRIVLLGAVVAAGPLAWWWLRHRSAAPAARLRALTLLTLFLTFDLVLFGAFTRLTDSGLGCPDWPGCYGSASPFGAREEIHAEQTLRPGGPVTHGKAWVEMVHRYLATGVGALITVLMLAAWALRRRDPHAPSPWWPTVSFVWVCAQGAFGALTVTLKLAPAIVTLHLLGGIGLLVLLAWQAGHARPAPLALAGRTRRLAWVTAGLLLVQIALGGWVSTNYAVLACRDFPTCQGAWWPAMDFEHAFTLWRGLGRTGAGDYLPFAALTAIHVTHRAMALLVLAALGWLAWRLHAVGAGPARRYALGLLALGGLQLATGLANVVLGWPLLAAVLHTGGAAALAVLLTFLLTRAGQGRERPAAQAAALPLPMTS